MEGNEYREYITTLGSSRTKALNGVVANIKILSRVCLSRSIDPPIKCDVENSTKLKIWQSQ